MHPDFSFNTVISDEFVVTTYKQHALQLTYLFLSQGILQLRVVFT